jgi:hypothetical protein
MTDPYYDNRNQFIPSQAVLNDWLNTKKSNNPSKPGLFETVKYTEDAVWTFISLLVELAALSLTFYGAYQTYLKMKVPSISSAFLGPVIVVVLFVFFDVVGIMFHSSERSEKTRIKSQIVFTKAPLLLASLYKKLKLYSGKQFMGVMALIVSAILKIFAVTIMSPVNGRGAVPLILIMSLFYLVVIYVHIYHSGYFLAARRVSKKMKKEWDTWFQMNQQGLPTPLNVHAVNSVIFSSPQAMPNGNSFQMGFQTITFIGRHQDSAGAVSFNYQLDSLGCMWDSDVVPLYSAFAPGHFQSSLLEACVQLQLSQLGIIVGGGPVAPAPAHHVAPVAAAPISSGTSSGS